MARFFAIVSCLSILFAVVTSQGFDYFGGLTASAGRDSRANRGPITFPMSGLTGLETSGVVVGASGYGFVPPGGRGGIGPQGSGPSYFSGFEYL